MVSRCSALVVAALVVATGSSCSDDEPSAKPGSSPSGSTSAESTPTPTPTPTPSTEPTIEPTPEPGPSEVERLPIGKSDLDVPAGAYLTPEGFEPEVQLNVTIGWSSVHRDVDGFDLGMPDPDQDAPLVAVVFLTPPEGNAADALSEIEARANGSVRAAPGLIGSLGDAKALDVTGGTGQLVVSSQGGIALDANPEGRMQISATDVGGKPLVVVIYVPDATRWQQALPLARALVNGTTTATS